jgi:predicted MFS family arabinose efflux permease
MNNVKLNKKQILIMAVTCGICIANVYYSQPLLASIALDLKVSNNDIGLISVLSQAGYGLGLFFITPLGDKIDRKKMILGLQAILFVSLLGLALASNIYQLYIFSLITGLTAIAAQIILPMAAAMVTQNRGKVVGQIFTGLLIGVLSARVISGFIGEWLNWRYVYILSSGLVLVSALFMHFNFSSRKGTYEGNYVELLRSTLNQLKRFPLLRRTALTGALIFGTVSSFWITFTFHLSGQPLHLSSEKIGLFGILAVVGALMAPFFGRLSDKSDNTVKALMLAVILILVSTICLLVFPFSILFLSLAVLLLDLGVQAAQVTNISLIYTFDSQAGSRINTVYMTSYFLGGSLGAYTGLAAYQYGGWLLVTLQMLLFTVLAFFVIYTKDRF